MTDQAPIFLKVDGGHPQDCDPKKFWSGVRIKPRSRSSDSLQAGLTARVADPLWFLARQWQMGEFKGEDNGSPIWAELRYDTEILDRVTVPSSVVPQDVSKTLVRTPIPFSDVRGGIASPPLETVVEQEPIALDWRTRVQVGQHFERLLRRALGEDQTESAHRIICVYRRPAPSFGIAMPVDLVGVDYATQRFLRLMQGRAIDGAKLLGARQTGALPELPGDLQSFEDKIHTALKELEVWYKTLYQQPESGVPGYWKPSELEYEFALSSSEYLGFDDAPAPEPAPAPAPVPIDAEPDPPTAPSVAEPPAVGPPTSAEGTPSTASPAASLPGDGAPSVSGAVAQDASPPEPMSTVPTGVSPVGTGPQPVGVRLVGASATPSEPQPGSGASGGASPMPAGSQSSTELRTRLIAPDYRNGDLDWYSCDLQDLIETEAKREVHTLRQNPTRVLFAGKPNERWWAFEDANVNLAKLDAATPNLARLLMLEFSLVYADDWYLFPVELPLGSMTRIRSLVVKDVFGFSQPDSIGPAIEIGESEREGWQLFTVADATTSGSNQPHPGLFLPPTLGAREESSPIEEVRFLRDEGANMVFAIEKTLQNGVGTPWDGSEAQLERLDRERKKALEDCERELAAVQARLEEAALTEEQRHSLEEELDRLRSAVARLRGSPAQPPPSGGLPVYRLASPVRDNWIPYVPKKVPQSRRSGLRADEHSARLRQAVMVRSDDDSGRRKNAPLTRTLSDQQMDWLNEESVPRAGVKLQLTRQRVRWTDGKTYVWIGRKVLTGRGEGASGLRFDLVINAAAERD